MADLPSRVSAYLSNPARPGLAGLGGVRTGSARRVTAGTLVYRAPLPGMAGCGVARRGSAVLGEARQGMGIKRQPREIWRITRERIWQRDNGCCQHCAIEVALDVCHIDHIRSGRLATNADSNLRVLCRRCHVLRADMRHRGLIQKALADGIIPPNWRSLVWED